MEPRPSPQKGSPKAVQKPAGGFQLISVVQLCLAYHAYRSGAIRLVDLRAYLACHELVARRCLLQRGQKPRYGLEELARLLGGGAGLRAPGASAVRTARGSVARLQAVGLLTWSETALTFAVSPDELRGVELSGFWSMLEVVPNNRRRIPVPRRILRLLAGGARRGVLATVLGHLLTCCYLRGSCVAPEGRCKASWVAETFGVDLRRIKAARAHLVALGWLLVKSADAQWKQNRWGRGVVINLDWGRPNAEPPATPAGGATPARGAPVENSPAPARKSPPPPARSDTVSPPPRENRKLLPERDKNQQPAFRRPAGACALKGKEGPRLQDVKTEDLKDTGRLLQLFEEAQKRGLINGSDMSRLDFVAAAEHALVVGTKNPPGLFATLVRRKLWSFVTQDDEEAARRRLLRHREEALGPMPEFLQQAAEPVPKPQLSTDARFVRDITALLRSRCIHQNPQPLVQEKRPEWTKERWERAAMELLLQEKSTALPIEGLVLDGPWTRNVASHCHFGAKPVAR